MSERVAELPEELWRLILRDVPLGDRLGSCAVVCQKLHAAAVAATDSIVTQKPLKQPDVESFVAYLQKHGKHVADITAEGRPLSALPVVVLEQLPSCQNLQDLCLKDFNLQLHPDYCHPGVLDTATGLTRLELTGCMANSPHIGDFTALSVLVNLQDLRIADLTSPNPRGFGDEHCAISCPGLSLMKHLTHLKLSQVQVQSSDLCHIGCMSKLCVLHVSLGGSGRFTPSCALPASVRDVYVCGSYLNPIVLEAATLLTRLELCQVRVEAVMEKFYFRHYNEADQPTRSGEASFLEMLSKLQHLDVLSLSYVRAAWPPISPAYKALVASSKLRELRWDTCGLPAGLFAQLLPHEASSRLGFSKLETLRARHYDKYVRDGYPNAALDAPGVNNLVSCCPALQLLECEVLSGVDLTPLSRLTALTQLFLALTGDDRDAILVSVHSLAALTGLQHLSVELEDNCYWGDCRSLQPLTALRQLTGLRAVSFSSYIESTCDLIQRGLGDVPNVWLQLLGQCVDAINGELVSKRDEVQRLEQDGDPTAEEQQQLAAACQQLAELEREVAEPLQQWQQWQHLAPLVAG